MLYGLDQLRARGLVVRHNLEHPGPPPLWARHAASAVKRTLERAGGYGGDFATVLGSLREANRADVVFSTVDTVGIPLVLAKRARFLRPPLVYAAIGLPERLERLRGERMRRRYAAALGCAAAVVVYSEHEADVLREWLAQHGESVPVSFVPFGVDPDHFTDSGGKATVDIVSVGADPLRDLELLLDVAGRMPDESFRVVTTTDRLRTLGPAPENVTLEADLPFDEMRRRLAEARVVALPVRENSYSAATTVLLQAMALAKPVVVTRTKAIASGYGLVDGENARLVPPGDADSFERALLDVLGDDWRARALGASARATVERDLTWDLLRRQDRGADSQRDSSADTSVGALAGRAANETIVLRVRARWIGVGGFALLFGFALAFLRGQPFAASDQGIYLSIAARMLEGDTLYAEVSDPKDPLFFYTYAAALWIVDWRGPFLLDGVWLAVASVSIALLLHQLRAPRAAVVASFFIYPLALTSGWFEPGLSMLAGLAVAPLPAWALATRAVRRCGSAARNGDALQAQSCRHSCCAAPGIRADRPSGR